MIDRLHSYDLVTALLTIAVRALNVEYVLRKRELTLLAHGKKHGMLTAWAAFLPRQVLRR